MSSPDETDLPSRRQRGSGQPKSPVREWAETVILAIVVALLIRAFLIQVYKVDGDSMVPTLTHGDRLIVFKLIYRLRGPQPGEIVVLKDPFDKGRDLIKRVIAVGGETVEIRGGIVHVDGKPVREEYRTPGVYDHGPVTVPERHIFVMGDNRMASLDSRWIGPVPFRFVQGKAVFRFWPLAQFAVGPLSQPRSFALQPGSQ
jgi:signal peptidase I